MESDFKRQIERALMPSPGNFGPNPDIQIRHNPERAIITSTATASSYIESHLKKAGFDFAVEGAKRVVQAGNKKRGTGVLNAHYRNRSCVRCCGIGSGDCQPCC